MICDLHLFRLTFRLAGRRFLSVAAATTVATIMVVLREATLASTKASVCSTLHSVSLYDVPHSLSHLGSCHAPHLALPELCDDQALDVMSCTRSDPVVG